MKSEQDGERESMCVNMSCSKRVQEGPVPESYALF